MSALVPPHSTEAEESVVGGILVHQKAFGQVAEFLKPEHFYNPATREIYAAMVSLDSTSKPIDTLTVAAQMRESETFDKLRAFGGTDYLTSLMAKVVTVENLTYHARIVFGKATARRLVAATSEIAARGYGEYGDIEDYVEASEQQFFAATQSAILSSYESARKIFATTLRTIEKRYEQKKAITGVPTDFEKLDQMTSGLQPCDLVIIAARPSMGKTALAMNIASNAAIDHKIPVLVFSLEMSKEALMERLVSARGSIDAGSLKSGILATRDWIQINKEGSSVATAPIFIDDAGAPTMLEIRSKCRRWRSDPNVFKSPDQMGMVVIDYLQLVQGRQTRDDNRQVAISEISRGMKALAKELRVPVVALSQLNRGLESRADKRPMLSDLRESGAIEQDADVIAFIYRDEVYSKDQCEEKDRGIAEIIIGKQRNGPTGVARLAWLAPYTRFENLADDRPPPTRPMRAAPPLDDSEENRYP